MNRKLASTFLIVTTAFALQSNLASAEENLGEYLSISGVAAYAIGLETLGNIAVDKSGSEIAAVVGILLTVGGLGLACWGVQLIQHPEQSNFREGIRKIRVISAVALKDPELARDSGYRELVEGFRFDQSISYSDQTQLVASLMLRMQSEIEQFHGESYPVSEVVRDVLGDHYNERNSQILTNLAILNEAI